MRKLLCTQILDNVIIVTSVTMHDPGSILAFLSDLHAEWFVAHTAVEKQWKTALPFYLSAYNSTLCTVNGKLEIC